MTKKPLKRLADMHTDLIRGHASVYLMPNRCENHYRFRRFACPEAFARKCSILICYSKPEDGFKSSLNVFFDSMAEDNLNIESIYHLLWDW